MISAIEKELFMKELGQITPKLFKKIKNKIIENF